MQAPPLNAVAAVIHPDPYPYYADLVTSKPIAWDETAKLWVAASAAAVTAVLTSDLCRVRPTTEPVPNALLGSPAADIFRHLVRMNDGQRHGPMKGAVSSTLQGLGADHLVEQSRKWARVLVDEMRPAVYPAHLPDFAFRLPVYVIASLLGIPEAQLPQTALLIDDFVRCLSPLSSPEQIEQSKSAAGQLLELFDVLLRSQEAEHSDGLLPHLAREARRAGAEERAGVIANGIGFLSQAYEATAGLIGNTLLALARQRDVYEQVLEEVDTLPLVIQEVLRSDPSVQNTRRYLADAGTVAGKEMHAGDTVLIALAAANRDPTANAAPERFELLRKNRRLFTFGAGTHGCPGDMSATTIARAGVAELVQAGLDVPRLAENVTYRPSVNVRIPLFAEGGTR